MRTEQQYKDLTVKEFTKAAEIYESGHAGIYEMCKDDYPYISEELEREEFRDLLDCGCGTGPMISLLYEKNPHRHYTGIDLTPKMIEVARAKNLPGVDWVVGDCENLPFDENSFDAVICSNSFHHYPNPQRFFSQCQKGSASRRSADFAGLHGAQGHSLADESHGNAPGESDWARRCGGLFSG
jgi:ubiquinone/menaquinone biosynthesis C-methylase UbiE